MKLVYVACPLAAPTKEQTDANVAFAKVAALKAMERGLAPFVPHLMYPALLDDNDPEERTAGIRMDEEILSRCDLLWVCGTHLSRGVREEISFAHERGIPVEHVVFDPREEPCHETYPEAVHAMGAADLGTFRKVQNLVDDLMYSPTDPNHGLLAARVFSRIKDVSMASDREIEAAVKGVLLDMELI